MKYIICCFLIFSTFYCFSMPENFIVNIYDKGKFDKIVGSINVSGTNMYFTNADYRMFPLESNGVRQMELRLNEFYELVEFRVIGDYDVFNFSCESFLTSDYDIKFMSGLKEFPLEETIKNCDTRIIVSFIQSSCNSWSYYTNPIKIPQKNRNNLFLFYTDEENSNNAIFEQDIFVRNNSKIVYRDVEIGTSDITNSLYILLAMSSDNKGLVFDYKNKLFSTVMIENGYYSDGFVFNADDEPRTSLGFVPEKFVSPKQKYCYEGSSSVRLNPLTVKEACFNIGLTIKDYAIDFYKRKNSEIDYPFFIYLSYDTPEVRFFSHDCGGFQDFIDLSYEKNNIRGSVFVYAFLHTNSKSSDSKKFNFYIYYPKGNSAQGGREIIDGANIGDVEQKILKKVLSLEGYTK